MRRCRHAAGLLPAFSIAALMLGTPAWADDGGAALFKQQCGACHIIDNSGGKRQGPNLLGMFDRPIGSLEGFKYSKDLKASEDTWTPELLDKWLEKPKAVFKSTFMIYRQKKPEVRAKIITYLQSASKE